MKLLSWPKPHRGRHVDKSLCFEICSETSVRNICRTPVLFSNIPGPLPPTDLLQSSQNDLAQRHFKAFLSLFGLGIIYFWSRVSCIPGWSWIHSIARMTWPLWSSSLYCFSAGLTGIHYHVCIFIVAGLKPGPCAHWASTISTELHHQTSMTQLDKMTHIPDIFPLYSEDCARTQVEPLHASPPCAQLIHS